MWLIPLLTICLVEFNVCFVSSRSARRHDNHYSESPRGRPNEDNGIMNAEHNKSARFKRQDRRCRHKQGDLLSGRIPNPPQDSSFFMGSSYGFKDGVQIKRVEDNVDFVNGEITWRSFLKDKGYFDDKAFIRSMEKMFTNLLRTRCCWRAWLLVIPQVKDEAAEKMMKLVQTSNLERDFDALVKRDMRPDNSIKAMELRAMLGPGGQD